MKQLALVAAILLAGVVYGQQHDTYTENYKKIFDDKVTVEGIGEVWIEGKYQMTALNRNFPAFKEVVDLVLLTLESNGLSWTDYKEMETDVESYSIEELKKLHFSITTGGYIESSWEVRNVEGVVTLMRLYPYTTGFMIEVDTKYL